MGFGNMLKGASEALLNATGETANKGATNNKNKELGDIREFGSISGETLRKSTPIIAIGTIDIKYSIDYENERFVAFEHKDGMFKAKNTLLAEYSWDEFVEIRHEKKSVGDYDNLLCTDYENTLFLSSGENFRIYNSIWVHKKPTREEITKEMLEWLHVDGLIRTFILKAKDLKTKEWINSFYLDAGGAEAFNEKGELDYAKFCEMAPAVSKRKMAVWEKKLEEIEN